MLLITISLYTLQKSHHALNRSKKRRGRIDHYGVILFKKHLHKKQPNWRLFSCSQNQRLHIQITKRSPNWLTFLQRWSLYWGSGNYQFRVWRAWWTFVNHNWSGDKEMLLGMHRSIVHFCAFLNNYTHYKHKVRPWKIYMQTKHNWRIYTLTFCSSFV